MTSGVPSSGFSEIWVCFEALVEDPPPHALVLSFIPPAAEAAMEQRYGARVVSGRSMVQEVRSRARAEYVRLIARIGATPCLGGRTLRQALQGPGHYSRWWFLDVTEKDCLSDEDTIYLTVLQLMSVQAVKERHGIERVRLRGAPPAFAMALGQRQPVGAPVADLARALALGLLGRLRLFSEYVGMWWTLRRLPRPVSEPRDVLLQGYCDSTVRPDGDGSLNDRYFTALPGELARRGLSVEFTLLQREAPYLPVAERQSFLQTFGNAYEIAFSSAQRGSSGANLALFSRLNRQGLLQEIEQRQAQLASLPGPQQALAGELRAVTQQLASMTLSPEQRQQLKGRQEELEKKLYRLLPQLQPRVVEVQQVAAALPPGSALIEFQRYDPYDGRKPQDQRWGEARYLALVLKPDGAITPIDLGLAKPIDASIKSALEASEQKQADALELWAQVGRSVLDPLAAATRGVSTLFISPDGELNRVPFSALPAPGSSRLLSEALQLRLLTTGRELLDLQNASNGKTSQALVVANPAFDRSLVPVQAQQQLAVSQQRSADLGSQRWGPLPGTAKEGAAIAQLTGGRLLAGEQASAAAIQQQQQVPRLLHLATHAYFQPDLPEAERKDDQPQRGNANQGPAALRGENPLLRSGIALAGANQPDADPADDGYLTALEVARLNWKGTELVVISACESGKGDIQAGEGVYGLKRAIAVAGARSSLLSLWKVDDRATAAFMVSFYNKLKTGTGRADALAATQKEFRDHAIAGWRHPYVWAAFQLSGDWGVMRW